MENTKKFEFKATIGNQTYFPKGFYYQGKFVVLVGCTKTDHTIRRKVKIEDVKLELL